MTVPAVPSRCDELATEITSEHEAAQAAARSAVEHAWRAGVLLIEAKSHVSHGEWEAWIRDHLPFSERTAQGYMRVARKFLSLSDLKAQRVADLPLRKVLAELAEQHGLKRHPARRLPGMKQQKSTVTDTSVSPVLESAPPPTERTEREWERARSRASECRDLLEKQLKRLAALPLPEKIEDFKPWVSALRKLGSEATMASEDFERWPSRIEKPPLDPHEVTYVNVGLVRAGVDLPDLTREELLQAFKLHGKDGVAWDFRSDAKDMKIMDASGWCLDSEPPSSDFHRWALSIWRPAEPIWVRGFWSHLGQTTLKKWGPAWPPAAGEGPRGRAGWTVWGGEL